jgi:hypothetical protein
MHQTIVDIPMPNMYDVKFAISSHLSGNMASINITPSNWDGYYNVQIAPDDSLYYIPQGENPTDGLMRSLASYFYDNARKAIANGSTVERYLSSTCYKGAKQINMTLDANKKYMVYVFAVESENGGVPVMRSVPSYAYL